MSTPAEYAQALREVADYIEAHPQLPTPSTYCLDVFRANPGIVARAIGSAEKVYQGGLFILRKTFGPIRLEYNFPRGEVCRRVVVGTREVAATPAHTEEIYEWVCDDPVLSK